MSVVFERPHALIDVPTHYCPGCTHGIVHRILAEVIDEMGIEGDTIGVCPVGCSVMAYDYFNCDMIEAAHGRAPAVATGVKRTNPDKFVFTYQGDGDLAAIGTAETVHSATRGENIVVIFINNTIYGMTGGQMAPTTLPGQVTQTTPFGRVPVAVAARRIAYAAVWKLVPRLPTYANIIDGSGICERESAACWSNDRVFAWAIAAAFVDKAPVYSDGP